MTPARITWLSAALAAGLAATASALDVGEQMQFADGVYARGLWDVALKEYEVALGQVTNTPDEAMVLYRMGECHRSLGRTNEAETLYARAGAVPAGGDFRVRAGMRRVEFMESAGRLPAAVSLASELMRLGPTGDLAAACRYTLGSLQERLGRTNEAAAAYEAILRQHAGSPYAAFAALAMGNIAVRQDPAAARAAEFYGYAASNAPAPRAGAEACFQLAELYFRQRQFDRSARAYERLMALYPDDERVADSRLQLAWASHHAGSFAEALALCDNALKAGAADRESEWLYLKANCERQLSQREAAVRTYDVLLRKFPSGELADMAGYERALVLFQLGRFPEALQQARSLRPNARTQKDVYWLLAECGAALNDNAAAAQNYGLLVDKFPQSDLAPDAMYRLAHLLQKKGDLLPAAEWFNRLASGFPTNALAPQALFAAGVCENKAGKPDAALRDWARLVGTYPQSRFTEEALYRKGLLETNLKRDEAALATWRELLRRYPASAFLADAQFWSGVLLEEGGQLDAAEASLRAALAAHPAAELETRARYRLSLVLQRRNQPDEAAALLQGLLTSAVTNRLAPELLEWLVDYQLQRKDYAKAAEAAGLLAQRADTEAWQQIAWCLNGKALEGTGRTNEARAAYEKAAGFGVKTQAAADARLRLGEMALQAKDYAAARASFEAAAALSSADTLVAIRVRAYAGIARTLKAQGDLDGAARHFLSVGVLFDDPVLVPECLHEAAAAYATLGRADESAKIVRDLVARYPESDWARRYKQ